MVRVYVKILKLIMDILTKSLRKKDLGAAGTLAPTPTPLKNRVSRPHIPHLEALRPEAPQHPPGELHLKAT